MTLVKQYFIDDKTGLASSTITKNLKPEKIEGLNILYHLEDANGYAFALSECQDTFISTTRIRPENLEEFQNRPGVGIITYVSVEIPSWFHRKDPQAPPTQFLEVTYSLDNDLSQYGTIEVIDQNTFDQIVADYNDMQRSRRLLLVKNIRSNILARINDFVPVLISDGVMANQSELTQEFKDWRQAIVGLGDTTFPRRIPRPPLETHGNPLFPVETYPQYQIRRDRIIRIQYRRWFRLYEITRINDTDLDDPTSIISDDADAYEE